MAVVTCFSTGMGDNILIYCYCSSKVSSTQSSKRVASPHPEVFLPLLVIPGLQNHLLPAIHACFSAHKRCCMLHHSSRNQTSSSNSWMLSTSSSCCQHFRVLSWCWRSCSYCHRTLSCSHITCSVVQLTSSMLKGSNFYCYNTAQATTTIFTPATTALWNIVGSMLENSNSKMAEPCPQRKYGAEIAESWYF